MPTIHEIDVFLHALNAEQQAQLTRALGLFHDAQSLIRLVPRGERSLPAVRGYVDWLDFVRDPALVRPQIVVTGCRLRDHWFTHTENQLALITLADWQVAFLGDDKYPSTAPDANLLLSLVLTTFLILTNTVDYQVLHERTIGCLCDLCADKPDRAIKMRTAFICNQCQSLASQAGLSVELDAIKNVLECVRALAMGRTPQARMPDSPTAQDDDFVQHTPLPTNITLPRRLVQACRQRQITVLVGSGFSLQADVQVRYPTRPAWTRLPTWSEVLQRMSEVLADYRDRRVAPRSCETLDEFLRELDWFRTALGEQLYYPRAIFDMFTPQIVSAGRANRLIFRLPLKWLLTANYDLLLNYAAPPGTAIYTWREARQAREYIASGERSRPLLKIHGCASRPDTIVLTKSEYDKLDEQQEYKSLMRALFIDHTLLFLGFGLTDPFDVDLAVREANLAGAAQGEKFALIPAENAGAIREKFPNIQVIAYQRHEQVAAVIASLVRESS